MSCAVRAYTRALAGEDMSLIAADGSIWMSGGYARNRHYDDLWRFEPGAHMPPAIILVFAKGVRLRWES